MTVEVSCPGSKSMTQRALVIAALAEGPTEIHGALYCDDSRHLSALLRRLGTAIRWNGESVTVEPTTLRSDGAPNRLGNAGTAVRFGSCLALVCEGALVIDGDEQMRRRPMGPLIRALRQLGVQVRCPERAGYPPLWLTRGPRIGKRVTIDGSFSSQYASGLLLVGPRLPDGLRLDLTGTIVSRPYLEMTVEMMRRAGATVSWEGQGITVRRGHYHCDLIEVEADWSAAAFLIGAGELIGEPMQVANLVHLPASLQGDAAFASLVCRLRRPLPDGGRHFFDLQDTPDLIAPLAAVALFAAAPSSLRGVAHARLKESDRIAVLCRELRKVGATVTERPDGLEIEPLAQLPGDRVPLDPEGDHRMAMALGLLALRIPGVVVKQPECVSKSFPHFWQVLDRARRATTDA
jgi:3-phosphoshikimate 1-carboxyvinyltransferase